MGHLTKWLFFNLMFGAIPYSLVVALNHLQSPGSALLHPSSEVLFIGVVATSSALGELWDTEDEWRPARARRTQMEMILLLGVLSSSLLYGAYVYHSLMSPGRASGIDCAAVTTLVSQRRPASPDAGAAILAWGPACLRWAQVQAGFFRWSLWLTGFCVIVSTTAVHRHRPRWR